MSRPVGIVRKRTGFTLLEVLIAIALALALGGAMMGFLYDMLSTRERLHAHAMQQRAAATLIERLEDELVGCIVGDSQRGAGVRGDGQRLRLLSRGVMPQLATRGVDDPASLSDLHVVEFQFNPAVGSITARKFRIDEAGEWSSLGSGVGRVRFRYLNGRQWAADYNSLDVNRLPTAVEVSIWFNVPAEQQVDLQAPDGADDPEPSLDVDLDLDSDSSARWPKPDRRRVILIPDAVEPMPEAGVAEDE